MDGVKSHIDKPVGEDKLASSVRAVRVRCVRELRRGAIRLCLGDGEGFGEEGTCRSVLKGEKSHRE